MQMLNHRHDFLCSCSNTSYMNTPKNIENHLVVKYLLCDDQYATMC